MKTAVLLVLSFLLSVFRTPAASGTAFDFGNVKAALLIDADTGRIILEKDSGKKLEAAGLKRLPALLTVCEAFDSGIIEYDATVTVPPEAAAIGGVTAFLSPGERISAELLLKASVMLTAGDSIYSLLLDVYTSETAALNAVDSRLKEIGCGTLSGSSMGGDSLFTASEIAKISLALADSEAYRKYSSVYTSTLPHEKASDTELTNPNRLVRHYSGCFGIATGSVGASEYSGAFIARRGTTTFLAVVLGAPDSSSRFNTAKAMLDYGFGSFKSVRICEAGEVVGEVGVKGGTESSVPAVTGEALNALIPVSEAKPKAETILLESIEAPVPEGDEIGELIIKDRDGTVIERVPVLAGKSVEKAGFGYYFLRILAEWMRG